MSAKKILAALGRIKIGASVAVPRIGIARVR